MTKHSFKLIGTHAVHVLARLAAKNAVKEKLRGDGVRLTLVPPREIAEKAQVYLEQHPELYQQALERAKQMGWIKAPNSGLFFHEYHELIGAGNDDDRLRQSFNRRPDIAGADRGAAWCWLRQDIRREDQRGV